MENLKNNEKVLVVLDRTYKNYRSDEEFTELKTMIAENLSKMGFDAEFDIMSSFASDYEYDIDAESMLKYVDNISANVCFDDYTCVIAEGFSAWFWLQALYSVPVLCINPVLNPDDYFIDFITDELSYVMEDILDNRGFQTSEAMCVVSYEYYDDIEEYDNVFLDNTVIRSNEEFGSPEFWSNNGSIIKALKYIKENYA